MNMPKKEEELFQFVLILKKEHPAQIDWISFLLCFISWTFFLYFSTVLLSFPTTLFWVSWLVPIALIRNIRIKRRQNKTLTYANPLLITGIVWLFVPGFRWTALLFSFFVFFDHQSRRPLEIGVSDERIVVNTIFRKYYNWNLLSNVILKDGLLTLDFKNNKIIQREIHMQNVNEKEFNSFCKEQLC